MSVSKKVNYLLRKYDLFIQKYGVFKENDLLASKIIFYIKKASFRTKLITCCAAGSKAGSRCELVVRNGPWDPLAQYIRTWPEGARDAFACVSLPLT